MRHSHTHDNHILDEHGPIEEILPETVVRTVSGPHIEIHEPHSGPSKHRRFADPATNIHVYPAQNRQEIIDEALQATSQTSDTDDDDAITSAGVLAGGGGSDASECTQLLSARPRYSPSYTTPDPLPRARAVSISHSHHHHTSNSTPKTPSGNLNMRGVFLHVLGDALGNIGVMATALFIWRTDYPWRFYFDPAVSLLITAIIFSSALPLVKSASKILLQAVPKGISLDEVKEDICSIRGIESVHELHIWQLSDVKMIASLHIQVAFDPAEEASGERYMRLARAVRQCLHAYGIHSSTIQPEYTPVEAGGGKVLGAGRRVKRSGKVVVGRGGDGVEEGGEGEEVGEDACLLECGDECGDGKCCGPMVVSENHHGHAH